jgi:hypothetical protein
LILFSHQSLITQKGGEADGVIAAPVEKPMRSSSPVRILSRKLEKEGASNLESQTSHPTSRRTGVDRDQVEVLERNHNQCPAQESIGEGSGPNDKHVRISPSSHKPSLQVSLSRGMEADKKKPEN